MAGMAPKDKSPPPFILPITFPNIHPPLQGHSSSQQIGDLVDRALSQADATCMTSWRSSTPGQTPEDVVGGVALGCADGSIFLFGRRPRAAPAAAADRPESGTTDSSRASSPSPRQSQTRSRSRSKAPSSFQSPLALTVASRARVVSGVSSEQVQAPKNYVDFDDEQEKLKSLLKGSAARDTHTADRLVPSVHRHHASAEKDIHHKLLSTSLNTVATEKGYGASTSTESISLLSASHSAARVPESTPTPTSPRSSSAAATPHSTSSLSLRMHILPRKSGRARDGVVALYYLNACADIVCLQSNGDLSLMRAKDGSYMAHICLGDVDLSPPEGLDNVDHPAICWTWTRLRILKLRKHIYAFACAVLNTATVPGSSDTNERDDCMCSRVVLLALQPAFISGEDHLEFVVLGSWSIGADINCIDFYSNVNDNLVLAHLGKDYHLISHELRITALQLSASAGDDVVSSDPAISDTSCLKVQAVVDHGKLPVASVKGIHIYEHGDNIRGLFWLSDQILMFSAHSGALQVGEPSVQRQLIFNVTLLDGDANLYAIITEQGVQYLKIAEHSQSISPLKVSQSSNTQLLTCAVMDVRLQASVVGPDCITLACHVTSSGHRKVGLHYYSGYDASLQSSSLLWKARHARAEVNLRTHYVSCALVVGFKYLLLGHDDGVVGLLPLNDIMDQHSGVSLSLSTSSFKLSGCIKSLHSVHRYGEQLLIGGADDGSVAIWSLNGLQLCGCWIPFTVPLKEVVQLNWRESSLFNKTIFCIASDGTIAAIALDDFKLLYTIPSAQVHITHLCFNEERILLQYANRHARIWNGKSRLLQHSTLVDKQKIFATVEDWIQVELDQEYEVSQDLVSFPLGSSLCDTAATSFCDLRVLFSTSTPAIADIEEIAADITKSRTMQVVLESLLTSGLDRSIDAICTEKLGLRSQVASIGLHRRDSVRILALDDIREMWTFSEEITAAYALAIIALLRAYQAKLDSEDLTQVITFYASLSSSIVGDEFCPPSVIFLAQWYFDPLAEIQQAAQKLFHTRVGALAVEEALQLNSKWHHLLPHLVSNSTCKSNLEGLLICGHIAVYHCTILPASALENIAKSIILCLQSIDSNAKAVAVDLCSAGFGVWQQYVNAPDLLRALFVLASNSQDRKSSSLTSQARQAILSVISQNTALFITTLSMDITCTQKSEYHYSVMQLLAFLVWKRPSILHSNIPRLVEAVVKSLDSNGDAIQYATNILSQIVEIFPMVDFHTSSQHLAVGTNEGAVIMYDLKTRTRLYVLEGNKGPISACSFSQDGRRLITIALKKSTIMIWKVGASLTSFFTPGVPPRQGNSGSNPFKTIPFSTGADGISAEEALARLKLEWIGERSARLKICDNIFAFSI